MSVFYLVLLRFPTDKGIYSSMPRLTNLFGLEKQLIRKQIEVIYRHNPRLFFPRCFVNISLAFLGLKKQYFENFNIELGSQQDKSFYFFPVQSDIFNLFEQGI